MCRNLFLSFLNKTENCKATKCQNHKSWGYVYPGQVLRNQSSLNFSQMFDK